MGRAGSKPWCCQCSSDPSALKGERMDESGCGHEWQERRPWEPSRGIERYKGTSGQRREEIREYKELWGQRINTVGGD